MDLPPLPFACPPVQEIAAEDRAAFDRAVQEGRGVVVRGLVRDWPATRALAAASSEQSKVELLRRMCRYHGAYFTEHGRGYLHYDSNYGPPRWSFFSKLGTFRSFARRLQECLTPGSEQMVYMQALPIRLLPGLRAGIRPLSGIPAVFAPPSFPTFWIGSGGLVINSHFDLKHNLMCIVAGVKRVLVAAPTAISDMYLAAIDQGVGGAVSSLARLLEFDTARFPRLVDCVRQLQVVVLGPGDAMYLPPCWWHHVESFGLNVMVNAWRDALTGNREWRWMGAIVKSIAWASQLGPGERAAVRAVLAGEAPPEQLRRHLPPDSATLLAKHLTETLSLYEEVGPYFRMVNQLLHDYYVFERFGPPVPLPAHGRDKMIQRLQERLRRPPEGRLRRAYRAMRGRARQLVRQVSDWPIPRAGLPGDHPRGR